MKCKIILFLSLFNISAFSLTENVLLEKKDVTEIELVKTEIENLKENKSKVMLIFGWESSIG